MRSSPTNAPSPDATEAIALARSRYEALKAAAASVSPKVMPNPTPIDAAPLAAAAVLRRETIPGGWYWTSQISRGETLRLLNVSATPGVSLFAWNAKDRSERYNSADTIKVQWTSELRKGRLLLSDMGRVLFSIVEDTCGMHDTVVGGSTAASNLCNYGSASLRSTRANMLLAAGKHGLGPRDIAPVVTFFAPLTVTGDAIAWRSDAVLRAGEFVDLRAEIDLIVAVSNCPHPLAPQGVFSPGEVEAIIHQAASPLADDLCRTATPEARRAFENNAAYLERAP